MPKALQNVLSFVLAAILALGGVARASADVTVFAAASLTSTLTELGKTFQAQHGVPVKFSFAASGALAKQIESGAPADVFASADSKWMDYLYDKDKIDAGSRVDLLGNTLVLVAPIGKGFEVNMAKGFDFPGAFSGKLCTGLVDSVPVGIYAKEAMTRLGWWDGIRYRVVGTEDVRAALNLVERGECGAGIVYETDARQSEKVAIVAKFPADTHARIVYPFVLVKPSDDAEKFLDFLKTEQASEIFLRYGFTLQPR
ncbi:MAG: molybdate ABC transporter substrate-binding protein [Pseudomonadota bacterium]